MAKNIRVTTEGALAVIKSLGWSPASIIDIGVALGTKGLYPIWPEAHICLIEPSPASLIYMNQIAERYPHVHIYNVGASNRSGQYTAATQKGLVNVVMDRDSAEWTQTTIPIMTCDEIVRDAGLPAPFLYKLDTDSHEREVLEGSAATLEQSELCIVEVNVFNLLRNRFTPDDMWGAMRRHGFTLLDFAGAGYAANGLLRTADLMFVKEGGALFDLAYKNSGKAKDSIEHRLRQQQAATVDNKFI